jgi:hypothetical protein
MAVVPLQPRGSVPPSFDGFTLGSALLVKHVNYNATRATYACYYFLQIRRLVTYAGHENTLRECALKYRIRDHMFPRGPLDRLKK